MSNEAMSCEQPVSHDDLRAVTPVRGELRRSFQIGIQAGSLPTTHRSLPQILLFPAAPVSQ